MAGDWIKMRTGLRRHPKVIAMSRHLAADRQFINWWTDPVRKSCRDNVTEIVTFEVVTRVTVCGLLEVWGAVNAADKGDGMLPYMRLIDVDDIAGIPGFGDAMMAVGWVRYPDGEEARGIEFPNFQEFNTPDSKRKGPKSDAQRAREYRERKKAQEEAEQERHERHEKSRREEKRREENKREGAPVGDAPPPKAEKPKSKARGERIPDSFPTEDELAWAKENHPGIDAKAEAEKFVDYWRAVSGQKGVKLDWPATWRNWIRRCAESGGARSSNEPSSPAHRVLS